MTLATNKKLEELFDLPSQNDNDQIDEQTASDASTLPVLPETLASLDKIEAALPAVHGLEKSDEELDELSLLAKNAFNDLSDLGMQVDSRYASEIFAVAGTMLGHAITAKTAKLNKKLKMIDLQLRKARLDRESGDDPTVATGTGHILDRNELLERLVRREQPKKPE